MFSGKGKKRPLSDTVTSSFLDEFGADRCDNELPSFLFNMATSKDNSLFKTPEINRNASKVSNQSTPLSMMPTEKANSKTPSPGCMTSTPKRVQSEEINLSELLQEEFGRNPRVASPKGKKHINLGAPFGDSFLQNQSSILNPDNVRPVGTYTISLLEEEYDKLYGLIKEGREKNMQAVSNVIQAMKDRVDRLASELEGMIIERYQTSDQYLQEAFENFERELSAGKSIQDELHNLRQKINAIVNMHLQTPTKRH